MNPQRARHGKTEWVPCLVDPDAGIAFFDGITIRADPLSTWQTQRVLPVFQEDVFACRQMRRLLRDGTRVFVPNSGNGVFAVWAARHGCAVRAYDLNPRAEWMLRENAEQNGIAVTVGHKRTECDVWPEPGTISFSPEIEEGAEDAADIVIQPTVFPVPKEAEIEHTSFQSVENPSALGLTRPGEKDTPRTSHQPRCVVGLQFLAVAADGEHQTTAVQPFFEAPLSWGEYCSALKAGASSEDVTPIHFAYVERQQDSSESSPALAAYEGFPGAWQTLTQNLRELLGHTARHFAISAAAAIGAPGRLARSSLSARANASTSPAPDDPWRSSPLRYVDNLVRQLAGENPKALPSLLLVDTAPFYLTLEGAGHLPCELGVWGLDAALQPRHDLLRSVALKYRLIAEANVRTELYLFFHPFRMGNDPQVHVSDLGVFGVPRERRPGYDGADHLYDLRVRHDQAMEKLESTTIPADHSDFNVIRPGFVHATSTAKDFGYGQQLDTATTVKRMQDDSRREAQRWFGAHVRDATARHAALLDLFYHETVRRHIQGVGSDWDYSSLRVFPVRLAPTLDHPSAGSPTFRGVIWFWAFSRSGWSTDRQAAFNDLCRRAWLAIDAAYEAQTEKALTDIQKASSQAIAGHEVSRFVNPLVDWIDFLHRDKKVLLARRDEPPPNPKTSFSLEGALPLPMCAVLEPELLKAAALFLQSWFAPNSTDEFSYLTDDSEVFPTSWELVLERSYKLIRDVVLLLSFQRLLHDLRELDFAARVKEGLLLLWQEAAQVRLRGNPGPSLVWYGTSKQPQLRLTRGLARLVRFAVREYFQNGDTRRPLTAEFSQDAAWSCLELRNWPRQCSAAECNAARSVLRAADFAPDVTDEVVKHWYRPPGLDNAGFNSSNDSYTKPQQQRFRGQAVLESLGRDLAAESSAFAYTDKESGLWIVRCQWA